jgi:hypothetical protein
VLDHFFLLLFATGAVARAEASGVSDVFTEVLAKADASALVKCS